jgi:murein L,D-transpeptidase YafK
MIRYASILAGALVACVMPACARAEPSKALAPIPARTLALMAARGTSASEPLVIRTYKKEAELEIWKRRRDGRFVYIKTFPICRWSGQLGPKLYPGDRQTPEGFYEVGSGQMNPNSHYYLSFDTGFPNAYDKAHGASGSAVMIHGTCSSMGCFAMTDAQIGEIYAIAREALKGGQHALQLQAYPFRLTARNMALYRADKNITFWRELKEGSDRFESTGEILSIDVVAGQYRFAPSTDPGKEAAARAFHASELAKTAAFVAGGDAAVTTTYADGGQNAIFAALMRRGGDLGVVSRPEALAYAGIDLTLVPRRHPHVKSEALAISVADWRPDPAPLRPTIVKVHAAAVPAAIDALLVAPAIAYGARGRSSDERLIAGAMPRRAALLAD